MPIPLLAENWRRVLAREIAEDNSGWGGFLALGVLAYFVYAIWSCFPKKKP